MFAHCLPSNDVRKTRGRKSRGDGRDNGDDEDNDDANEVRARRELPRGAGERISNWPRELSAAATDRDRSRWLAMTGV